MLENFREIVWMSGISLHAIGYHGYGLNKSYALNALEVLFEEKIGVIAMATFIKYKDSIKQIPQDFWLMPNGKLPITDDALMQNYKSCKNYILTTKDEHYGRGTCIYYAIELASNVFFPELHDPEYLKNSLSELAISIEDMYHGKRINVSLKKTKKFVWQDEHPDLYNTRLWDEIQVFASDIEDIIVKSDKSEAFETTKEFDEMKRRIEVFADLCKKYRIKILE